MEVAQNVSALRSCQDRPGSLVRSLARPGLPPSRSLLLLLLLQLQHVVDVRAWPPGHCLLAPPLPFFSTLNKVLVDASLQSRPLTLFPS